MPGHVRSDEIKETETDEKKLSELLAGVWDPLTDEQKAKAKAGGYAIPHNSSQNDPLGNLNGGNLILSKGLTNG